MTEPAKKLAIAEGPALDDYQPQTGDYRELEYKNRLNPMVLNQL